jgi:L,D-transpeptidase catalytic domain
MKRYRWMPGAAALIVLVFAAAGWVLLSDRDSADRSGVPPRVPISPGLGAPSGREASASGALPGSSGSPRRPAPRAAEPAPSGAPAAPSGSPTTGPSGRSSARASEPGRTFPRAGQPLISVRRGARIALRTKPGGRVVKTLGWQTRFGSHTVLAVFARRGGWAGAPTPLLPHGRLGWVRLDPARLRAGWTRYSIDVDLSSKAAVLRLGKRTVRSFSVTVGAPASPTPSGRFAITDTFRGGLNPAYGCCALATSATQSDLPSGWLGGNRIAIHGTTGPLGAALSHGCIRASNAAVSALVSRVGLGTPVVIHE